MRIPISFVHERNYDLGLFWFSGERDVIVKEESKTRSERQYCSGWDKMKGMKSLYGGHEAPRNEIGVIIFFE